MATCLDALLRALQQQRTRVISATFLPVANGNTKYQTACTEYYYSANSKLQYHHKSRGGKI